MQEGGVYTANDLVKIKEELIKTRYEINNSIDSIHIKDGVSAERIERLLPANLSSDYTVMIALIDKVMDEPFFGMGK